MFIVLKDASDVMVAASKFGGKRRVVSESSHRVRLSYFKSYAAGEVIVPLRLHWEREAYSAVYQKRWIICLRAVATGRETFQQNIHWPGFRARLTGLSTSSRSPVYCNHRRASSDRKFNRTSFVSNPICVVPNPIINRLATAQNLSKTDASVSEMHIFILVTPTYQYGSEYVSK